MCAAGTPCRHGSRTLAGGLLPGSTSGVTRAGRPRPLKERWSWRNNRSRRCAFRKRCTRSRHLRHSQRLGRRLGHEPLMAGLGFKAAGNFERRLCWRRSGKHRRWHQCARGGAGAQSAAGLVHLSRFGHPGGRRSRERFRSRARKTAAETIRLAAAAGLIGGSIEDSSGAIEREPILRLRPRGGARDGSGAGGAPRAPFPFVLTARAENLPARTSPIWTTPCDVCRPSRPPARTCCSHPLCRTSRPCAPCAPP